jgi:hypothetical protein
LAERKLVQKYSRCRQVCCLEAFAEAAVYASQKIVCRPDAMLIAPQ